MDSWHDKEILPGNNWDEEIKRNLQESDIVVFLLSVDFLTSTYIYENEIKIALDKHEKGEIVIVPVMLRKCHIKGTIFKRLQGLPSGFEPITSNKWPSHDEYFVDIVDGLEEVIKNVKKKKEILRKKNEIEPNNWSADEMVKIKNNNGNNGWNAVHIKNIYVKERIQNYLFSAVTEVFALITFIVIILMAYKIRNHNSGLNDSINSFDKIAVRLSGTDQVPK